MLRVVLAAVALLVGAKLFVACPEPAPEKIPMSVGPCGPIIETGDAQWFAIGPSVIPTGLPDFYSAWFMGATRPDCPADLDVAIEPMEGSTQDIPANLLTADVSVSCFNPPSESKTFPVTLTAQGPRLLTGTFHMNDAPSCMDAEHRAGAEFFGQPFSSVTVQLLVKKRFDAAMPKIVQLLSGSARFRHSSFESWRVTPDAGDAAVDAGPKRVRFTKPADQAVVTNPVAFAVAVTSDVASVELEADGKYRFGGRFDPKVKTEISYPFSSFGERVIRAIGFDSAGREIGSDTITIFIVQELVVAQTYFYVAQEDDYDGGVRSRTLSTPGCGTIALPDGGPLSLPIPFFNATCIEGTAKTHDGLLVNYVNDCPSCTLADQSNVCPKLGDAGLRTKCWEVLDPSAYPWGKGASTACPRDAGAPARSCSLMPLVSWATDKTVIPLGTTIYAPDWDGRTVAAAGGVPTMTLDGCFRADDTGDKIKGTHVDIFAGSKAMQLALEGVFRSVPEPYTPWMHVMLRHPKCRYLAAP